MAIDFDLNTIKKMPIKIKILVIVGILALIGYLYWTLFFSSAWAKKDDLTAKLTGMQAKITEQEKIASQLNKYQADVAALQQNYKIALQKLPDQREIPSLFHAVASAGKEAGVEFALFEPKASVPKSMDVKASADPKTAALLKPSDQRDQKPAGAKPGAAGPPPEPFYEEIPVAVSVLGSYQNILSFFYKVSKLPRIVNISDISIGDRKEVQGKGTLVTSTCTIKTYKFIDKEKNK